MKKMISEIKKIAENMLRTRPEGRIVYRPYFKNDAVTRHILGYMEIDLRKIYPEAAAGDFAWIRTELLCSCEADIILSVRGGAEVFFNGERVYPENGRIRLHVKETGNIVEFRCTADESGFGVGFVPSTVYYPEMWAADYLMHIRAAYCRGDRYGEDGVEISELNSKKYPHLPRQGKNIDFTRLYGVDEGKYAFALSYCVKDGDAELPGGSYVNRAPAEGLTRLSKGDEVLISRKCENGKWGLEIKEDIFGIPFITSRRESGTDWLLTGVYDSEKPPEADFRRPDGGRLWRFADGVSYLRPYLDTAFFGQWFYALMVGQYGILQASEYLGSDYREYFERGIGLMAEFFDYAVCDAAEFGSPTFLQRGMWLDNLDSIGTVGMNMCELYKLKPDAVLKSVIDRLYEAMSKNVPRFEDGTFRRPDTMWADDTFMSCPFIMRLAEINNDAALYDECINQLKGFYSRLYMKDKKLFSHIYFIKDKKANRVPWGRGNGWVFITLSDALERIPKSNPEYFKIAEIFTDFAEGIASVQAESGMWRQVLDMSGSYEETSCTAMFVLGMARGIRMGILGRGYEQNIRRAVRALLKTAIDDEGGIYGVCRGSGCSYNAEYYANLGTVKNDDHGTGIILAAFSECVKAGIV